MADVESRSVDTGRGVSWSGVDLDRELDTLRGRVNGMRELIRQLLDQERSLSPLREPLLSGNTSNRLDQGVANNDALDDDSFSANAQEEFIASIMGAARPGAGPPSLHEQEQDMQQIMMQIQTHNQLSELLQEAREAHLENGPVSSLTERLMSRFLPLSYAAIDSTRTVAVRATALALHLEVEHLQSLLPARYRDAENAETMSGQTSFGFEQLPQQLRLLREDLDQLAQAAELRELESPNPRSDFEARERSSRSHKRRKTSRGPSTYPPKHVKQVAVGQINEELIEAEIYSCDGGNFTQSDQYTVENILKSDNSVYVTNKDRCNIILRRKDDLPFSVSKIIIKGPRSGFDSPYVPDRRKMILMGSLHEGSIYISMESEPLNHIIGSGFERSIYDSLNLGRPRQTARRGGHWPRPLYPGRTGRDSRSSTPTLSGRAMDTNYNINYLDGSDNEDNSGFPGLPGRRRRSAFDDYQAQLTLLNGARRSGLLSDDDDGNDDDDIIFPSRRERTAARLRAQRPDLMDDDFQMSIGDLGSVEADVEAMLYREPSSGALRENLSRLDRIRARLQQEERLVANEVSRMSNIRDAIQGSDNSGSPPNSRLARYRSSGSPSEFIRLREARERLERRESNWLQGSSSDVDPLRPYGTTESIPQAPHAKFTLRAGKRGCIINFDTPISGRFVLFRLQSLPGDKTIDIESIALHGFSGPRAFPKNEFR